MSTQTPSVAPARPAPVASVFEDFTGFFRAHADYVWCSLRRLGVRPADLEDLSHEVFLAVYRQRDQYDPARPMRPWLFGFAFRIASDHRRRARQRYEVPDEDSASNVDHGPSPEQQLEGAQRRALVHRALESIALERRAVFVLHEIDGEPIPAVAESLGIPTNTAYSRLRLAREEFAAAVQRLSPRRGTP